MYINLLNTMVSKILKFGKQKVSFMMLPAHGRDGARATSSLAAHFAKRNTKFGGGGTPEAERFAFATGQEARAGPEGETLFPCGVNKNSCFLLAP